MTRFAGEDCPSLVEALERQVRQRPQQAALTFLADGESVAEQLSYEAFQRRVLALAAHLQAEGAAGERVLLLLPSGIDYVVAFWACLHAKAVAVPLYPPGSSMHAARVARVASHCGARWAITHSGLLASAQRQLAQPGASAGRMRWVAADAVARERPAPGAWRAPLLQAEDLAFLQYTSGSTGEPRGVMVSHGNLLRHAGGLARALRMDERDVMVSWLPLFHDMGLIGTVLQPLLVGAQVVLMPPATFVQRPARWLEALSHHRGTMSFAPNFAYDLCATVPPEGLDLSRWRLAINAAEPVQAETVRRFGQRFAAAGLRQAALAPAYGLAEATLMVSTHPGAEGPPAPLWPVDAAELARGRIRPASHAGRSSWVVSCGQPQWPGSLSIVDPDSRQPLAEGQVGEIWVRSPGVAQGYWHSPESTQQTFHATRADGDGPWLRTGDLGALWQGQLVVAGRIKDLVIVRGQNHHPGDLEHSAWLSHAALAPGRIAAFAVEVDGEERVAMAAELRRTERKRFDGEAMAHGIAAALAEEFGLRLHALVLLAPGALPITSSGKVQRQACRRAFLEGRLDALFVWQAAGPAPVADGLAPGAAQEPSPDPHDASAPLLALLLEHTAAVLRLDDARRAELRHGFAQQRLAMLGVDSLAAIELSHRLHAATGEELGVAALLGGDVAADLARQLHERQLMRQLGRAAGQDEARSHDTEVWTL